MRNQYGFCGFVVFLVSITATVGLAGDVTLNFNTDGVLPDAEALAVDPGSTVTRYDYKGMDDEVVGGLWKSKPWTDPGGYVGYYGDLPTLATSDTSSLVSIMAMEPLCSGWLVRNRSQAVMKQAMPLFMSAAPRP